MHALFLLGLSSQDCEILAVLAVNENLVYSCFYIILKSNFCQRQVFRNKSELQVSNLQALIFLGYGFQTDIDKF